MGVDVSPVAGVGRQFSSTADARAWFLEHFQGRLSERERTAVDDDFTEFLEESRRSDLPKLVCMDAYHGYPWMLLYEVKSGPTAEIIAHFARYTELWSANFQDEGRAVFEARVH